MKVKLGFYYWPWMCLEEIEPVHPHTVSLSLLFIDKIPGVHKRLQLSALA